MMPHSYYTEKKFCLFWNIIYKYQNYQPGSLINKWTHFQGIRLLIILLKGYSINTVLVFMLIIITNFIWIKIITPNKNIQQ